MRNAKILFVALLLGASLQAQVVISQPVFTNNGSNGNEGQSFTPNNPTNGGFTGSTAYLTQFTFVAATAGTPPTTPIYLLIYTSYSGNVAGTLLETSTNTQTWSTVGYGGTATFNFTGVAGGVALDKNTVYFAVFSESSSSVVNPSHDLKINNTNPYPGGLLLHQGSELAPWDSVFSATFAIPEPSTYAALAGLAVLGLAVWRRVRG